MYFVKPLKKLKTNTILKKKKRDKQMESTDKNK